MGGKNKEEEKLITSVDASNLKNIFSLAIKGAGTNRDTLEDLIIYERVLKSKIEMTLKVIKDKSK